MDGKTWTFDLKKKQMLRIAKISFLTFFFFASLFSSGVVHASNTKHGNQQVLNMLSDRPAMKGFVTLDGGSKKMSEKDAVWIWAREAYGKSLMESAIEWDKSNVSKPIHYLAEHVIPYKGSNGRIRIRQVYRNSHGKIRKSTFEELWSACIFELINIQNHENFLRVYHQALQGEITRDKWVRLNTELEHEAILKLDEFFIETWKPWAEKNSFRYDQRNWRSGTPEDYEEWIAQYQKGKSNPYKYWEDYYNTIIIPYLEQLKGYKQHAGSNNAVDPTAYRECS